MNNQQPGAKYNPDAQIHVILSGVIGRPKVVEALFLNSNVEMEKVQVPGYGERIQKIGNIGPSHVREDMAEVWKDKPYMGALGVVKAPGETAEATRITTTVTDWKNANKLLRDFNYHAYGKAAADSWFHNEGVTLPGHEGQPQDIIEAFADTNGLEPLSEEQKSSDEFQKELADLEITMAGDIRGFREKMLEGNIYKPEQQG